MESEPLKFESRQEAAYRAGLLVDHPQAQPKGYLDLKLKEKFKNGEYWMVVEIETRFLREDGTVT